MIKNKRVGIKMEYSEGMGIELPKWVITTASNKKFLNRKNSAFTKELSEECIFDDPTAANDFLKHLDFGYVVKTVRYYIDKENTYIRMA